MVVYEEHVTQTTGKHRGMSGLSCAPPTAGKFMVCLDALVAAAPADGCDTGICSTVCVAQ